MVQKIVTYAALAATAAILLSSSARIGLAIFSSSGNNNINIGGGFGTFDVAIDNEDGIYNHDYYDDADHPPILPVHQRKLAVSNGDSGPGGIADVLPGLLHLSSQTRSRKLNENNNNNLPYKCGVLFYDHTIPGEAGDLLNNWIMELVNSNENASLLGMGEENNNDGSKSSFVTMVEDQIKNIGPNEWKIVYNPHKHGMAFNTDFEVLESWREIVELGQNDCQFITAAIFTHDLDHSIKHTKRRFKECGCSMEEFKYQIMDVVVAGGDDGWSGQLDHFLYSNNVPTTEMLEMKDKVKRGMKVLQEQFDIVLVHGHESNRGESFPEKLLKITGWSTSKSVQKPSVSDGGLLYSKELVSAYGKMSAKNGDADFIDAVGHVYHNSLDYLMLQ